MATAQVGFSRVLAVPPVNAIHQVVEAFARTSEQGAWQKDTEHSDPFELVFTRGNWGKSTFGFGKDRIPKAPTPSSADDRTRLVTRPALLKIGIRPSPKSIRVLVNHTIYFREVSVLFRNIGALDDAMKAADREEWKCQTLVEVDALRSYIKEFYDLPELPLLEEGAA